MLTRSIKRGSAIAQNENLKNRIAKIEREPEPDKGKWLRSPDGEAVGDVMLSVGIGSNDVRVDETERN